jgi:hypothetical protein
LTVHETKSTGRLTFMARYIPRQRKTTVVPSRPHRARFALPEREELERALRYVRFWGVNDPVRASLKANSTPGVRRRVSFPAGWLGDLVRGASERELTAMLRLVAQRERRRALQLPRRNPTRVLYLHPGKREVNVIACDRWPVLTVDRLASAGFLAGYRPRKPFVARPTRERIYPAEALR